MVLVTLLDKWYVDWKKITRVLVIEVGDIWLIVNDGVVEKSLQDLVSIMTDQIMTHILKHTPENVLIAYLQG
jgi:hypothetical protein